MTTSELVHKVTELGYNVSVKERIIFIEDKNNNVFCEVLRYNCGYTYTYKLNDNALWSYIFAYVRTPRSEREMG